MFPDLDGRVGEHATWDRRWKMDWEKSELERLYARVDELETTRTLLRLEIDRFEAIDSVIQDRNSRIQNLMAGRRKARRIVRKAIVALKGEVEDTLSPHRIWMSEMVVSLTEALALLEDQEVA